MTRKICLLAAALLTFALVGCKATEEAKTTAQVRVVHFSPDTEALTVKIAAGATKVASVATGAASGYVTFDAASTAYEVRSLTDNTLLAARTIALTGGSRYTLYLYGRRNSLSNAFVEEDTLSPSSGKFRFRVDNFSNILNLDVYFVTQTADIPAATASLSSSGSQTASVFTEVAEGDYQLVLTSAGTKDIVFEGAKQHFSANTSYTVAPIAGKSSRLADAALLTTGESGTVATVANLRSRVRALHASPDAPMLSFNNNGQNMFSNVPYKANSSYITSVSGDRTMSIDVLGATGTTTPVSKVITLTGGEDYTLVAGGRLAALDLVKLDDNNLPPITGKFRVRFVNMNVDASSVDLLVNFSKTLSGIAFKSASSYLELDAGTYAFGFNSSSTGLGIATTDSTILETGKVYTVLLFGSAGTAETKIVTDN